MIRVFYANDPLAADQGGGAEHFRGIFRALGRSGLDWRLVGARLQDERRHPHVEYISATSHFGRWYLALWLWFWRHRHEIADGDVLHFHRNYAAWPAFLFARGRARIVITYHNVSGRVLAGRLGAAAWPLRCLMKLLERRAVARADRLVCVSELDRGVLAREVAPGPFARATVLAAGIDATMLLRRSSTPPDGAAMTRLLFLGRLEHQKNPELAVEVLERLVAGDDRGWTLTIAGDGGAARALDRRIAASPARDRIVRVGLVPHDQVAELIDAHGILLATSRYEASPTVVKEALLRQRPVVTTRAGDVARWIEPCNGTMRRHDAADLADGVLAMAELVAAGGWRAGDRLGPDAELRLMDPLIELYRSLHSPA